MIYAEDAGRRTRQILGDVLLLAWCILWALAGRLVYRTIQLLQGPAERLNDAAGGLGDQIGSLSGLLPGPLQSPFDELEGSTESVGEAATSQIEIINDVATVLGLLTALVPIAVAVAIAVLVRRRWWREASAVRRLRNAPNFEELMARRAIVHQPLRKLAAVSADPMADLEAGRFEHLASLELSRLGIRTPSRAIQPSRPPS